MKILQRRVFNKFQGQLFAVCLFWYLALFPGRLGFDYSLAIRMIHAGKTSDQWTGAFFWFLKLTSFAGTTIAPTSFLTLLALIWSLTYFVRSLPFTLRIQNRTILIACATPLVGAFGVNISHDVFLVCGIFTLTGYLLRTGQLPEKLKRDKFAVLFGLAVLVTSFEGIFVALSFICIILMKKNWEVAISGLIVVLSITFISLLGIAPNPDGTKIEFLVSDLKCVAQHPDARITDAQWTFLETIAPKNEWLTPVACSYTDPLFLALKSIRPSEIKLTPTFIRNYLSIFNNNPLIVVESHLQRSAGALPPPFFQGPENQVNLDTKVPIGFNTNIALQTGPEVLHPSIDEPSVHPRYGFLKPLEFIAQSSIFLINQASWFWGWGGLWLWSVPIFMIFYMRDVGTCGKFLAFSPVITLHLLLVFIGPSPLPRYVMDAVLIGLILTLGMTMCILEKFKVTSTLSNEEVLGAKNLGDK